MPRTVELASRWSDVIAASVVGIIVVLQSSPVDVLSSSLPIASDLGGHAVGVWSITTDPASVLPGGWSDAMLLGYPANQLYPYVANGIAAAMSLLLGLGAAVKVAAVLPAALLPLGVVALGRHGALPLRVRLAAILGTFAFVFDSTCSLCGGTLGSATRGEMAFGWGLLLAVVALGLVDRLLRSGRAAAWTGVVTGVAFIAHPVTALWLGAGIAVLLGIRAREWWPRRLAVAASAALAALIALSWWLPLAVNSQWMPVPGFGRPDDPWDWVAARMGLLGVLLVAAAVGGAVAAVLGRWTVLVALAGQSVVSVVVFLAAGEGAQLEGARVWPFYLFGAWVLASVGVLEAGQALARRAQDGPRPLLANAPIVVLALAVVIGVGATWGWWFVATPATPQADGVSAWGGRTITSMAQAPAYVYGGVEAQPDAADFTEVLELVARTGRDHGCGRLMWDATDGTSLAFGDPYALVQVPIWTDGCIDTGVGVYIDSSSSSPGVFTAASLVSPAVLPPGNWLALPPDLAAGVGFARNLGVRYLLVRGERSATTLSTLGADAVRQLERQGDWTMWQVTGSEPAADLANLPAVTGQGLSVRDWTYLAMQYQKSPTFLEVPIVSDGPAGWPRAAAGELPPTVATAPAGVRDVVASTSSVTFAVATPGKPVLVRVSAYPGWQVDGANQWFRASPNSIVVVPDSEKVRVFRSRTAVDWWGIGCISVAAMLALAIVVAPRLRRAPATSA